MRVYLPILGLFILSSISAQNIKRFHFQFDIGATCAIPSTRSYETRVEFYGHPKTNYKSGLGYFAEILTTYNFNNNWGLQSGLNFTQNKIRVADKLGLIVSNGDIKTAYINLPILIKYRIFDSSPLTVTGGAYLGLILNAFQNGTSMIDTAGIVVLPGDELSIAEPTTNYSDDIKSNFKNFDFGLTFQINYEFTLSEKLAALIFSRFNFGLINVKSDEYYEGSNYSIDKWSNIGLLIGIGINI